MADIKTSFSKGLTAINLKTAHFIEQNKMQTYITTLNQEIAVLKSEIGESIYGTWLNGNSSIDHVQEKLRLIKEKNLLIKQQEQQIEDLLLKEKQILGAIENKAKVKKTLVVFCPQCGEQNDKGNKFCISCGATLENLE